MNVHRPHSFATRVLRVFWVLVVLTGELLVFLWTALTCHWPAIDSLVRESDVPTKHILLVADTQVQHSALITRNSWWASPLWRALFDLNTRKNWHVTSWLKPDAVIFMGDMITNGKAASSFEEYDAAAQKFKSIFRPKPGTDVYYVPGNNDVGLGLKPPTSQILRSYYTKSFGQLNQNFVIQNHTFIAIDSPGLIGEDYLRNGGGIPSEKWAPLSDGTVAFVKQVAHRRSDPTVLLTHIPLSRSESANCGPLRERGTIHRAAGSGWQSMISKQSSNFLLRNLQPLIVFSADNRDFCDYTHVLPYARPSKGAFKRRERIREVTLKSFSPSAHIRHPGFQLVTLIDPDHIPNHLSSSENADPQSLTEGICFLPDQYGIYTSFYLPLFLVTLLVFVWLNFRTSQRTRMSKNKLSLTFNSRSSNAEWGKSRRRSSSSGYLGVANCKDVMSPFGASLSGTITTSPRSQRTLSPNSSATFVGSPNPTSPSSTTMLLVDGENSIAYFEEDEDEDMILPPHYSELSRSNSFGSVVPAVDWDPVQFSGRHGHLKHDSDFELEMPPGYKHQQQRYHDTSKDLDEESLISSNEVNQSENLQFSTFTLHGRRRRIKLGLPWAGVVRNLVEFFAFGSRQRLSMIRRRTRKNQLCAFILLDMCSIFWAPALVWAIINGVFLLQ